MEIIELEALDAERYRRALECGTAGTLRLGPGFNSFKASERALLLDPINGNPSVFVAPATLHVFEFERGSGTDHLRQRSVAALFFQSVSSPSRAAREQSSHCLRGS